LELKIGSTHLQQNTAYFSAAKNPSKISNYFYGEQGSLSVLSCCIVNTKAQQNTENLIKKNTTMFYDGLA
jgi:hypothetical protein